MQTTTALGTIVPSTFSPLQDFPCRLLSSLPTSPTTPRRLAVSDIITLPSSASPPSLPSASLSHSHEQDPGNWGLTRDCYTTAALPPPLIHIRTTPGIAQAGPSSVSSVSSAFPGPPGPAGPPGPSLARSVGSPGQNNAQNRGQGRTRGNPANNLVNHSTNLATATVTAIATAPAILPPPYVHHRTPRALHRPVPKARERATLFAARSAAAFTQPSPKPPPSDLASLPSLLPFPLSSYTTPPRRLLRSQTPPSIPTMPEYRHSRGASLNASSSSSGAQATPMAAAGTPRFDGPRSPPNTAHVPCKFFRQGACQAGNACPFSHDLGAAAENVCKYFAKGNCKFGPKCANIHVLPDGRRINYGKNGVTIGTSPISLAGRANPASAQNQPSTSALTTSLYHADTPAYSSAFAFDEPQHSLGRQPSLENGLPTIDMSYTSSAYGSPRDEDSNRFGLGLSPVNKGLSVLDAPLPASFDSNGISNAARFPAAPWPSSVPNKFGLESPSQSLSNAKDSRTSETLKLLHTSAFGSSEHLIAPIPNSPPSSHQSNVDEYFGKRAMHSSRFSKPRMLSSSMPKIDRDWESEFVFGDEDDTLPENYVPENLQDLLTPAEKARRGSMRADSDAGLDSLSKYGSPVGTSPSRWGPMFQRQKEEEDLSRSARGSVSAFGHVGSPLRNSILAQEMSNANGLIRPSSLRSASDSMSMLSQQLQRSHIDDTVGGSSPMLHPSAARGLVGAISPISPIGKERVMERHVSSGSISSAMNGRFTTPINEDDEMFHMEGMEEDGDMPTGVKIPKRTSGGLPMAWSSYAGVVSGKGSVNGTKGPRDSVPVSGR